MESSSPEFPLFTPPGCPRRSCPAYARRASPEDFTFLRRYRSKGYPGGVPLFYCERGEHAFSLRRFAVEFRLHKPHLTAWAVEQLVSSVSLRQAARQHRKLSRAAIERRLVRFGLHGQRLLRRSARRIAPLHGPFYLDEAETFEEDHLHGPLTIPVLLHGPSRFTFAAHVATLAPRISPGDRRWNPEIAARLGGKRVNRSQVVVRRALATLARLSGRGSALLWSDLKPSYGSLLRRIDSGRRVMHHTISGKARRGTRNPLFPINHLLAMLRDGLSRLRRRTWCHSKRRLRLFQHLGLYLAWKNFVRVRFNDDDPRWSAAQQLRLVRRRWTPGDLVRWRLDLGAISLDPFANERSAALIKS